MTSSSQAAFGGSTGSSQAGFGGSSANPEFSSGQFRETDAVTDLGAGLRETAKSATEAVRRQAEQLVSDVGHEIGKTGERQKQQGVESLRQFAKVIDNAANDLENQSPMVAHAVHEAARRVDDFSDNLANRQVDELVDSVARLARAQPALFAFGAVAAGFVLARFLKSSGRGGNGADQRPIAYRQYGRA